MAKQYQLPKEFAEKWVKALRSGEYKQGRYRLFDDGGYCCIAVGGKVCGLRDEHLVDKIFTPGRPDYIPVRIYKKIPEQLKGFASSNDLVKELTNLNDFANKSFPEIADWIEQNVEFV